MKNIAILTRTYNRPNYFKRCRESVEKCGLSENHYVIYQEPKDDYYLIENDVQNKIFIDTNTIDFLKKRMALNAEKSNVPHQMSLFDLAD